MTAPELDDNRPAHTAQAPQKERGWLARLAPLALLIGGTALILSQGWLQYLSLEQLAINHDVLDAFITRHWLAAIAVYMLLYVAVVALSLPGGAPLTISGGLLFGWFIAGSVTVVAATLGAILVFLIARSALGEPLAARAGPWLERFRGGFQDDAFHYLLFLRLVPLFPFWVVNLAPALLGMRLRDYALTTALGIIPGTYAFAFVGAGLDSVIDAQRAAYQRCLAAYEGTADACRFSIDTGALVTPELLIALALLGIVALLPVIVKKLRHKRRADA